MDGDGVSSAETNDEARARLAVLVERRHELWEELSNCQDEQLRSRLFSELAANREESARLKDAANLQADRPEEVPTSVVQTPEPPSSVGEALRARLVTRPDGADPVTVPPPPPSFAVKPSAVDDLQPLRGEAPTDSGVLEPAEPKHSTPEPADTRVEATRPIDPLVPEDTPFTAREDDLVVLPSSRPTEVAASSETGSETEAPIGPEEGNQTAHQTYQDLRRVGPHPAKKTPLLMVGIFAAVGAVAVIAWLVLLRPSGSTEITEAATTVTVDAVATPVDQIRAVLDGLGYGAILVEERGGTVHLAGVLDSDNDRSAAIAASQALAGDMLLDSSGIAIGGTDGSTDPPDSETGGEGQQAIVDSMPITGPYVEATLDGKDFVLAGVVPSAALATSYLRAAEVAYAPYVRSELVVDEDLEMVDWLSRGPDAITLLPMIIDGKLLISSDHVQVSGRSPDEAGVERLRGALGQIIGLPVVVGDMEVMDLEPPSYVIAADSGVVELGGRVPSQEIRDMLVEGALAAYGTGNVTDDITVDESVYPSLWMYSGGPLLQAMSTFPDYELRIDGTAFSGYINGGVDFESGSAVFSGDYAQALDVGVSVLTRDPSLQLVIEGHTDDRGFVESNRALSQLRAEAVRDYFIINGIDPSRLTAVGIGEAEPVVPNTSEAGRARNRRIQYVLSSTMSLP